MERRPIQPYSNSDNPDIHYPGQPFQRAHTYIGAGSGGHWIKMAGILSPLILGELIQDADKRWRWIRIISVATAALSEVLWAHRVKQGRQEREHCR
jgi:hypothetical protein